MKENLDLLTLMDFLGGLPECEAVFDSGMDESSTNYLQNGIRILTLAREKSARYCKLLKSYEHIALQLSYKTMPENSWRWQSYFMKVMRRYINKQIMNILKKEFPVTEGISFFYELIGEFRHNVTISYPKEEQAFALGLSNDVFKCSYSLMFELRSGVEVDFFGPLLPSRKKRSSYYHYRSNPGREALLVDTFDFIGILCFMNCVFKVIQILKKNEPDSKVIKMATLKLNEAFDLNWQVGDSYTPQGFIDVLLEEGFVLNTDTLTYEKSGNEETKSLDSLIDFTHPISVYYALYLMLYEEKQLDPMILFHKWNDRLFFYDSSPVISMLFELLHEMADVSTTLRDYESRHKNKHIATAYITKKNIPAKIMKAMQSSGFNNYFGYVEFDEDVDLTAVNKVELEFDKLNQQLFHNLVFPDAILRIRKLGKHKAAGLYYPGYNTLCVDIRSPSSFLHEYMHMLDDLWGDLSLSSRFDDIVRLYRSTIKEHLSELPESQRVVLNGISKYNLKYFFHPVEIFARCGEIYFSRILKIESSLLKHETEHDFAYPVSDELDTLIQAYYESILHEFIQAA